MTAVKVVWSRGSMTGSLTKQVKDDEYSSPDEVMRGWGLDGYKVYSCLTDAGFEYEIVLHQSDPESVAREFLDDLVDSLESQRYGE